MTCDDCLTDYLTFVNLLVVDIEQSKITYVYYDPNFDTKKIGRPRHGFYSKRDDQRADKKISKELYIEYPDIKHGQEVEFRAPEKKVISNNERLAESPYTKDQLRNMAYNTLIDILTTGNDNQKLAAAKELLDRIDGKAAQVTKSDVTVTHRAEVIKQVLDGIIVESVPKYIESEEE